MKINLPPFVEKILETFEENNYQIYIVGGGVRDILMGKEPVDWDFTTNAKPEVITSLFKEAFYDNKFGTVGIPDPKEKKDRYGKPLVYEVTTFRKEIGYSDARHPDKIVWGKTIEDDLIRRDFTMNAIALKKEKDGFKMIDPHHGQADIKKKLIRAVGKAKERFQEDALRMMRAIRLATQLGFNIEEKTFQAIKENVNLIEKVSSERVRDELLKLFSYEHNADGYMLLRNSGLVEKILPETEKGFGVDQKSPKRHHIWDVGTHSVKSLQASKSTDPILNLAILLHDVGKPWAAKKQKDGTITFYNHEVISATIAQSVAKRLKLSNKDSKRLITLVRWHQFTCNENQTDKAIRRFIKNVGQENLEDMLTLRRADRLGGGARETSWRLEKFKKKIKEVQKQPFKVTDLKVNGKDVMKVLKIKPGPMIGKILNNLFEEVVNKKIENKREVLLKRIKGVKKIKF